MRKATKTPSVAQLTRQAPNAWTSEERRVLRRLRTPGDIQAFLDDLIYDGEAGVRSPRVVLRTGTAQCLSGVLFACAALRELGFAPRLMYVEAVTDDSHCIAVYESGGFWGSLAKSNFTSLRSREPVYSYRELGLSYFDGYYNQYGQRTMRSFTVPLELEEFEARGWRFAEDELLDIDRAIDELPKAWRLPRGRVRQLARATEIVRAAGLLGAQPAGLWRRRR